MNLNILRRLLLLSVISGLFIAVPSCAEGAKERNENPQTQTAAANENRTTAQPVIEETVGGGQPEERTALLTGARPVVCDVTI